MRNCRESGAQFESSEMRRMRRAKLSPQLCAPSVARKRRVVSGTATSATHPSSVIRVDTSTSPSQARFTDCWSLNACASKSAPAGFTAKRNAFCRSR